MAVILVEIEHYETAIPFLLQLRERKQSAWKVGACIELGKVALTKKDFPAMRGYLKEAEEVGRENFRTSAVGRVFLREIAHLYYRSKAATDISKAIELMEEVIRIARSMSTRHASKYLTELAEIYCLAKQDYSNARKLLHEALQLIGNDTPDEVFNGMFIKLQLVDIDLREEDSVGAYHRLRQLYTETVAFIERYPNHAYSQSKDHKASLMCYIDELRKHRSALRSFQFPAHELNGMQLIK